MTIGSFADLILVAMLDLHVAAMVTKKNLWGKSYEAEAHCVSAV